MLEYLVIAAAVVSLFAAIAYIRSMFRGNTKPNRVTWLLWAIAPLIATAASLSSGFSWVILPVFMAGLCPLLIFAASIFTGAYWKSSAFDYICGVLSALALVLWVVTKEPNFAIVFAMASDALAAVPTINKAWRHPETESIWPYLTGLFGPAAGLATITLWSFSQYAFPIYLLAINVILVLTVFNKKIAKAFKH
jgi:hypothetical protein